MSAAVEMPAVRKRPSAILFDVGDVQADADIAVVARFHALHEERLLPARDETLGAPRIEHRLRGGQAQQPQPRSPERAAQVEQVVHPFKLARPASLASPETGLGVAISLEVALGCLVAIIELPPVGALEAALRASSPGLFATKQTLRRAIGKRVLAGTGPYAPPLRN